MRTRFGVGLIVGMALLLGLAAEAQTRDLGVDVSHYQGSTGVSQSAWNSMASGGKKFAYIKATEGLTGPDDAAMSNNVIRAASAGLLVGVYHYPHPENRPTTNGAVQEADHFLSYAGSAIGPGRLRPVLDVEGSSSTLSTTALTDWVIAFCDRIVSQRGVGAMPIIYANRSYAKVEFDTRLANYDLWLAYYTNVDVTITDPPPTTSYPKPTGVFNNWAFWQYSQTGSAGGISPIDLDVCHNDYKPLSSYLIPYPQITLSFAAMNTGTGFQLGFTGVSGATYTILATTNPGLPMNNWSILGSATESGSGSFVFTDTQATVNALRFYKIKSP